MLHQGPKRVTFALPEAPAFAVLILLAVLLTGLWPVPQNTAAPAVAVQTVCQELILNGGFEVPHGDWTEYSSLGYELMDPFYPHTGTRSAWLAVNNDEEDWLMQTVTLPGNTTSLTLSYWWALFTEENPGGDFDLLRVQLLRVDNVLVSTLGAYSNQSAEAWLWNQATADLSAYAGQILQLRIYAKNDGTNPTSFFVDDLSIEACTGETATSTPTSTRTPGPSPTPSATPRVRLFLPLIVD